MLLAVCLALSPASPVWADAADDFNVAARFYKDKQWEHAGEAFQRFAAQYPNHERAASAILYQGQSYVHLRKFASARDAFRTFVDKFPQHSDLYLAVYRIGECSYFLGDFRSARTELDRFISAYPQHELTESALQFLAESQLRLDDAPGAIATLQLQIERFPEGRYVDDARFLQGRAQLSQGDKTAALTTFETLSQSDKSPRAADALVEVGSLQYEARNFAKSRDAFSAVRVRFPTSNLLPTADLNAGYSCYHLAEFDKAIAHFKSAGEAASQKPDADFWIGMSQKSQGDFATAADTFKALAETETAPAATRLRARFHWADAELRRGDEDAAQQQFLAVVDADPKGPLAADALHLATEAALNAGDHDKVDSLFDRFASDHQQSGLWQLERLLHGRSNLARGDKLFDDKSESAARELYSKAATEFSEVAQDSQLPRTSHLARLLLARSLDRLERYPEISTALEPLIEHLKQPENNGEFAEAIMLTARAQMQQEQFTLAADTVQILVDRFPQHEQFADALALQAVIREKLNQPQQADTALDRLWAEAAQHPLAQRTTYQLAEQAYTQKNWSRASQLFERLLDGGAGEFEIPSLSGLGYSLYELKQYETAAQAFHKLVGTDKAKRPLAADAAHMRALSLRQGGDLNAAATAYEAGLKQFARAADATGELTDEERQVVSLAFQCAKGLARVRKELVELEAADAAYSQAVAQLQQLPTDEQQELDQLIHEWALLHYNQKNYDRSDKLFQQLVSVRPDSPLADDAQLYIGESHFFAGRLEEAEQVFTSIGDSTQADDFVRQRALVLLLDIAWERSDWKAVADAANNLIERFPQSDQRPYAEYRLGEALVQQGKPQEAITTLSELVASQDEKVRSADWFAGARLLLAESQLQARKYTDLETTVQRFREEDSDSPLLFQADEILGRRFKNEARWDEARTALRRSIEADKGRRSEVAAKAQLLIAETYLLEMKDSEAVAEYYKVYLNYPFPNYQAPALYQAAQCDERLQRWESAVKAYETLVREFPNHEYTVRAAPLLEAAKKRVPKTEGAPPAAGPTANPAPAPIQPPGSVPSGSPMEPPADTPAESPVPPERGPATDPAPAEEPEPMDKPTPIPAGVNDAIAVNLSDRA